MKEAEYNETAEYLGEAHRLREYIMIKEEQLASLREAAERISPRSGQFGVRVSGYHGSGKEDMLCKAMDLEEELVRDIGQMIETMRRVKSAVEAVEDKTMRMVLELRYLNFKTWEEISETMCYSERHIYRLHAQALGYVKLPKKKKKAAGDGKTMVRAEARL